MIQIKNYINYTPTTIFKLIIKIVVRFLLLVFIFWWLILSHVSFPSKDDAYYIYNKDKSWKVGVFYVSPISPIGLYQFLTNKRYIVLYDKKGDYIGQSTPFCFMAFDQSNILFPDRTDNSKLLFIPESCDYSININKPTLWSKIIKQTNKIFHIKAPKSIEMYNSVNDFG